jgi:hypothetical protein
MRRIAPVVFLALLLASSCREPTGVTGSSEARLELEHAMERWALTSPAAYEVTVRPSCFCDIGELRPVVVRVRGGTVESRRYTDDGTDVPAERAGSYPTVTRLFAFIADADAKHAARIGVTYDAALGYPVSIYVDYDEAIADEEAGFTTSDFHAIP